MWLFSQQVAEKAGVLVCTDFVTNDVTSQELDHSGLMRSDSITVIKSHGPGLLHVQYRQQPGAKILIFFLGA